LLPRAIDSVLNQTFSDWELIVVNDNSSDNTDDVMKKYNDPRIIYIKHAKNKGGSAARNNGLKAAKGEYIAFLDDDDRWLSTKLEKQVNIFENSLSKIGVIYSGVVRIDDTTQECLLRFRPSSKGRVYKEMLLCSFVHSATYMARRKCFKKVGYYDEISSRTPRMGYAFAYC
jgi:glycosyltransferase involved in cell wall biosynthesis